MKLILIIAFNILVLGILVGSIWYVRFVSLGYSG